MPWRGAKICLHRSRILGFMTSTLAQNSRVAHRAICELHECARMHSLQRSALLRQHISLSSWAQLSAEQCKLAMPASSTQTCRAHKFVRVRTHTLHPILRCCVWRRRSAPIGPTQVRGSNAPLGRVSDAKPRLWETKCPVKHRAITTPMHKHRCGESRCGDANSMVECRVMEKTSAITHKR